MDWSPQQDAALKAVAQWLRSPSAPQVFKLFGFAGTGKTTLALEIARMPKIRRAGHYGQPPTAFAAFTGKAAQVMRKKGCYGARTIHSLIYKPADDEDDEWDIEDLRFVLNLDSDLREAGLVIIDECSMVGEELADDLLSFGVKVLVLGDPAQLPPVEGTGYFLNGAPDAMLTEIHRQAADNPIIAMATKIRQGEEVPLGKWGESEIIARSTLTAPQVMGADQVLVGMNRTRHAVNSRIRKLKWGSPPPTPLIGERLVCLKNHREKGLFNGGLWNVRAFEEPHKRDVNVTRMKLASEDFEPSEHAKEPPLVAVGVPNEFWIGEEKNVPAPKRRALQEFAFGWALTCHKSQGSQWGSVVVFDESGVFKEDRHKWLYTAVTRAAERVLIVRDEERRR